MAGYSTPAWTNGNSPAINAANLTAMGQGVELAQHPYGVCSTASATAAKSVAVDYSGTLSLFAGLTVRIKFSNGNTAGAPTLNVNSTGSYPIMSQGTTAATTWSAGQVITFVYDGTNWLFAGIDAYTKGQTLSQATAASIGGLTGTTPATPDEAFALLATGSGVNISTGSYTGDGTSGANNKTSLTFPFVPKLVIVCEGNLGLRPGSGGAWTGSFLWCYGQTYGNATSSVARNFTQTGNTLTWWTTSGNASYQLNTSGTTYRYVALG